MTRIEMLMHVKHGGQDYYAGELRQVSRELAGYFCGLGWARDCAGEIATAAPDTSQKTLDVQSGAHVSRASHVE